MLIVAKVIVDVPTHQTNQEYDYIVPEQLREAIEIGYRVRVPFGNRLVQGYVVDICLMSTTTFQLKSIHSVMDTYSVLTHEMVQLGHQLSQLTFSFTINCYHGMLPALLKSDYDKRLTWVGNVADTPNLFNNNREVLFSQLNDMTDVKMVLEEIKKANIDVTYIVKDKAKHKTIRLVQLIKLEEEIVIRKGAKQLENLKQCLLENSPLSVVQLKEKGISTATINTAQKQGWVAIDNVIDYRDPYKEKQFAISTPKVLNNEQLQVFLSVKQSLLKNEHHTYLLQGVTGSGKTEVYMQLIQEVIQDGKTALMLVPEIALTPQMVSQFKGRFGDGVAVLHSGLSQGERYDEWVKIRQQKANIVVGARSSIFAPLENIGIIIIDEEHESTYKQMDTVRYHARDVAILRGKYHCCPVVLGSATPSLESRARAQKKIYTHLQLQKRANQKTLPPVTIVDMTAEKKGGNFDVFSQQLKQSIAEKLEKKEQIVLLLNRRGYSSFVMCRDCGYVVSCPNCDISMTLHIQSKTMKCHYCSHEEHIPTNCPSCFSKQIRYYGLGTQKVEEILNEIFPKARVIRMDVDTTRKKGQHEKMLEEFGQGNADILLGTQMIAKGLDFPNVTLVGVINADTALNLPDFRSSEKTFQLLTQVAGRSGRGDKPGEVIVQTYNPEHYVLQFAKTQDYEQFYRYEMHARQLGKYSPFYFSTLVSVSHSTEVLALQTALEIKKMIDQFNVDTLIVVGPTPQSIARVNNQYYFQVLLKYKNKVAMEELLQHLQNFAQEKSKQKIYVSVDVEPLSFM